MSLRFRFFLFSVVFVAIVAMFTFAVVQRGHQNRTSAHQIEADIKETDMIFRLSDRLENVVDAVVSTRSNNVPLNPKVARDLQGARDQIAALYHSVESDEVEDDAAQKEMKATQLLEEQVAKVDLLIGRIESEGGLATIDDLNRLDHYQGQIQKAFALFREGSLDEVRESLNDLKHQQKSLERLTINGAAGMILLLAVVWIGFAYGLLRPVQELTQLTRKLSARDFSPEGHEIPKGEIGELKSAFLSMAKEIASFTKEIEQRVTERTRELESSRARLKFMLDRIPDAVGLRIEGQGLMAANDSYRATFGEAPSPTALVGGADRTPQGYVRWKDPSGRPILLDVQKYSAEGDGEHLVLEYARDVTRMVEVEGVLAQSQRLVAMGRLAAGIAHEINSPLTAIAASAEGLLDRVRTGTSDPVEQREYLEIVLKEVYRCKGLTGRLLDVSRQRQEARELTEVSTVVRDCVRLTAHLNKARGVDVLMQQDGRDLVETVPTALRQILLNLLMNAGEASREGGKIEVLVAERPDAVDIQVKDDGDGISAEDLPRLFEPFFTRRRRGSEGTGLGLFLSLELANALRARLSASSPGVGHGATFTLSLPKDGRTTEW